MIPKIVQETDPALQEVADIVAIEIARANLDHDWSMRDAVYDLLQRGIIEIGPNLDHSVPLEERSELFW